MEKVLILKEHAKNIRKLCLQMSYESGVSAHLGGGLSIVEALTALYGGIMGKHDKFILSKGHGVLGYYATLAEYGIISEQDLSSFMKNGSDFIAHPVMNPEKGIEASTGSLGQGISMAVGLALASKKKGYSYQTFVLCGNGECNEGSVWEACMSAVNFRLDNFTLFLDNNKMQSDGNSEGIMNVSDNYASMLTALGFQVIEIDGNDIIQVYDAFNTNHEKEKPKAIVGSTIKGKGISFMENNPEWHHNRLTKDKYDAALAELETAE